MKERLDFFSKAIICIGGSVIFAFFFLKYIVALLLPFLIAWGVAFAVRRPSGALSRVLHLPVRMVRAVLSALIVVSGLSLIFFLIWKLISELWHILTGIGKNGELFSAIGSIMNPRGSLPKFLPEGVVGIIAEALEGTVSRLTSLFADFAARFAGAIPSVLLFIIITFIACIYFALDLERVNSFIKSKLPCRIFNALVRFKDGIFAIGLKYARAYFTIMLMTFAICLAGLLLLGVEYALLIAVVISVLDILPVIGIGTIFIPWSVFQFAFGSRALGLGLLVLFLIAEFIRQLAEPKIVGKNLGLHPIVSLILLYGSYSLFGIGGILLIPCAVVIINALSKSSTNRSGSSVGKNDASEVKKRSVRKSDGI